MQYEDWTEQLKQIKDPN